MSWTADQIPDQTGRTAVVTGAGSGLGLATTRALARKGAHLVLAPLAQSPDQGALPQLYAATAPGVVSGHFIGPDGMAELRGAPKRVRHRRRSSASRARPAVRVARLQAHASLRKPTTDLHCSP
ncbi:hypothetical protein ACFVH6_07255 [Spirillospora sp. NPDC127200]